MLLGGYFFLLLLSVLYSSNQDQAIKRVVQSLPIFVVPFLLFFGNLAITKKEKIKLLQLFVGVNLVYTAVVLWVFFSHTEQLYYQQLSSYLFDFDKFQFDVNAHANRKWLFMHKPYFSMGFVVSALTGLYLFLTQQSMRMLYLFVFVYFSCWVLYTFSFPNVLALIACALILLKYLLPKKRFVVTATLTVLVVCSIVLVKLKDRDVRRGVNFLRTAVTEQQFELSDARKEIYKTYLNIFNRSGVFELLLGWGVGDVQDQLNAEYDRRLVKNRTNNLFYYSEEFDNDYWFKHNLKVSANQQTSPDGLTKADKLYSVNDSLSKSYNISRKAIPQTSDKTTLSVYAKAGASEHLLLRLGAFQEHAIFDLKQGVVMANKGVEKAGILPAKDGWFRCFVSNPTNAESLAIMGLTNQQGAYVFKNQNREKSLYLWGSQLEVGNLTAYQKNKNELLQVTIDKELNSHNNYLYFLLAGGIVGLLGFMVSLGYLFWTSVRPLDVFRLVFCIVLALNLLTENILNRHWGLMFFAFLVLVLFAKSPQKSN